MLQLFYGECLMRSLQKVVSEHDIDNIFCACQDGDDLTVFAYITRDLTTQKHYCHVFRVDSTVCLPAHTHARTHALTHAHTHTHTAI